MKRLVSTLTASFLVLLLLIVRLSSADPVLAGKSKGLSRNTIDSPKAHLDRAVDRRVTFTPNMGQFEESVRFRGTAGGATIWFCDNGVYLYLTRDTASADTEDFFQNFGYELARDPAPPEEMFVRTRFLGASPTPEITGNLPTGDRKHFIRGNDPDNWQRNVPVYYGLTYHSIYQGIDVAYYGNSGRLEYDLIVAPGADPAQIQIGIDGIENLSLNGKGELLLQTRFGLIVKPAPVVYQLRGSQRVTVEATFEITGPSSFRFDLGRDYDPELPLIIDPVLIWSTLLGGSDNEYGRCAVLDSAGNLHVAGYVRSPDFPMVDPFDSSFGGGSPFGYDVLLLKLSPDGDSLIYATYIGGTDGDDMALGIALDASGNVYLSGSTYSTDFPTSNPVQASNAGGKDAFFLILNATGDNLLASTYLGGSLNDGSSGLALGVDGRSYLTGKTASPDFNLAGASFDNSLGGTFDAFVAVFSADGSALQYSTYIGGSADDNSLGIAVDQFGFATLTGHTTSSDFPLANALDGSFNGGDGFGDAFVCKFNPDSSGLTYSTFIGGGSEDMALAIDLGPGGDAFIVGRTSSDDFPLANPYASETFGDNSAFVTRLSAAGDSLVYSTYLGGNMNEFASAVKVAANQDVYIVGNTTSTDFPTLDAFQTTFNGLYDVFVSCLAPAGDSLVYSTYLGGFNYDFGYGITLDDASDAYVVGFTASPDFPLLNAMQDSIFGGYDLFITRMAREEYICVDSDLDGFGDPGHPENNCPDDNCPWVYNPTQDDVDGDLVGDLCDNCPDIANPNQEDIDSDGFGDSCDVCIDMDGDGFGDPGFPDNICPDDNCPAIFNPNQTDADLDGIGDVCDSCTDSDGDTYGDPGFPDNSCPDDNCPDSANVDQSDSDGDGIGDVCDNCSTLYNSSQEDADSDGIGDSCDTCTDTDGDGFGNPGFPANTCELDNCPLTYNPSQADADSNGVGDVCDTGCCTPPSRGNIDGDQFDDVNVADLTYIADFLFGTGNPPPCPEEGNVNGLAGIDVGDLTYMVDYLFRGGPPPAACPGG